MAHAENGKVASIAGDGRDTERHRLCPNRRMTAPVDKPPQQSTAGAGTPAPSNRNSLTVGPDGPIQPSTQTGLSLRFSTVDGEMGSSDTWRAVREFDVPMPEPIPYGCRRWPLSLSSNQGASPWKNWNATRPMS